MFYVSVLSLKWIYCYDHEFLKGNNSVTCQDISAIRAVVEEQKQNTEGVSRSMN